jgi:indolepyruvate ferredoxin oxidoreductase
VREFAQGLEEILVVEEKRQLIEYQMKEQLYNWRDDVRPRVVGKYDEHGEWEVARSEWLLPAAGELTPAMIARVIAKRIAEFHTLAHHRGAAQVLRAKEAALARPRAKVARIPYFCSGCPHNTSTRVPEGSKALAGIGCHYMAIWIRPEETMTFTQMGGEGAPWIGLQPFTETKHVFANLGDGTYHHSGSLAIRAAVAANSNITYKILFNDAVAMTGGQPHDGPLTVPAIARQVLAEGVKRVVVVSDDPESSERNAARRGERCAIATTSTKFSATCARSRRERAGLRPDVRRGEAAASASGHVPRSQKRVVINELVCEGCGDCSVKSNCLSVVRWRTEFGRKRAIDQSSCNKDYSCVKGFCPSFVTVEGGTLRKKVTPAAATQQRAGVQSVLPEPQLPSLERPYGILVTGVGGTGVVTIGAILGMAAHLEGKGVAVLDMAGLAQKGGSVYSHIRIAARPEEIHAVRIAAGEARVVLGCDMIVAASDEAIAKMQAGSTRAVINADIAPTGEFTQDPNLRLPEKDLATRSARRAAPNAADFLDATQLATALLGDSIATNLFIVGLRVGMKGLIPVSGAAIRAGDRAERAAGRVEPRGDRVGRRAAADPAVGPARGQRRRKRSVG